MRKDERSKDYLTRGKQLRISDHSSFALTMVKFRRFDFFPNRFFVVAQLATILDVRIIGDQTTEKMNLKATNRTRSLNRFDDNGRFTNPITTKNEPTSAAK